MNEKVVKALTLLYESVHQAPHDFCGEQREWHLPRITQSFLALSQVFPMEFVAAIARAKGPDGKSLNK